MNITFPNPFKAIRRLVSRNILLTIAILFGLSGLIRIGEFGLAIASETDDLLAGTSANTQELQACTKEADIELVLMEIQKREALVNEKEEILSNRLKALAEADKKVSEKLKKLTAAEDELSATLAIAETAVSDDLDRLTTMYESMKPKQAIPLFKTMNPEFAAGFLSRMKAPSAAQIMEGLDPQAAYAISVILAGRHSDVPTN